MGLFRKYSFSSVSRRGSIMIRQFLVMRVSNRVGSRRVIVEFILSYL